MGVMGGEFFVQLVKIIVTEYIVETLPKQSVEPPEDVSIKDSS